MNSTELLELLREFYRDKLAMRQRHVAAARWSATTTSTTPTSTSIAREDLQLNWLRDAITDMGGDAARRRRARPYRVSGKGARGAAILSARIATAAQAFVDKWRPRVDADHPRPPSRRCCNVILGETLEHKRFFEQALAGRTDLLGRRADGAGTGGGVLPTRWVE